MKVRRIFTYYDKVLYKYAIEVSRKNRPLTYIGNFYSVSYAKDWIKKNLKGKGITSLKATETPYNTPVRKGVWNIN